MAIFKCDSCGYERDVPDKLSGKKAKCPDCGHGVTIVDSLPPETEPLPDAREHDASADFAAGEEKSNEALDLDSAEVTISLSETEDVICEQCGHVMKAGDGDVCPKCNAPVSRADELPDIDEEAVDISDLAEDREPQVWEPEYPGNGDAKEAARLEEDEESGKAWSILEGNFALNVFAGLVTGVLSIFFAVAMSMLVSSQDGLQQFLPQSLASALTAMAVGCMVYSLKSRIPFAVSGPGTVLSAILFLLLGDIYRDMAGQFGYYAILSTLMATIAVTACLSGLALWFVGKFKAGEHIRYIPIQIIGGVIGAVGVFVLLGTFDWMGDFSLDWNNVAIALKDCLINMQSANCLSTMGPSVVLGLALFIGLAKQKNSLFLLCLLLAASGIGYGAGTWGDGTIVKSLATPIPYLQDGVPPLSVEVLKDGFFDIQWGIIKANSLYIGALVVLAILTTMYRLTKLELVHGREGDLSEEYRSLGVTNIVSGLCGGMPVALSFGRSTGSRASGARGPVAGMVAGLVCVAGLYFADHLVPLIPRYVPEGLLVYAGLSLIRSWMFKTKTSFTRRDDMRMLWLTFLVTALLGMLIGIGFGVALALMVTVRRNSMRGAVRNVLTGANHRSNVDRAPAQQRTLKEYGDHIHIMRLQGFLFLGSMGALLRDIQKRLSDRNKLPVEYLILDFKMVTGLASAAGIGFEKLRNLTEEYDIQVIITSAPLELEEHLEEAGLLGEEDSFKVFFNLDYAMEWCENHVLDAENMLKMKEMALPELLAPVFPEPKYIPALMKVLKRVVVSKGEAVFRQGDTSDSMYFVESGKLDVELELEGGKLLRLKKVGPGAVFGEMGIYTMAPRSATIRATEKCVLYMMTTEKLEAVEKRAPMLVTTIHRFMITMLSDRLADANVKVRDLMT